jgi:cytochrome c oxidase subunit 2
MVVPVGEPIHVVLASNDVVHAFYVPAFLFKRDAIPGRTNEFDLTIDNADTYRGQCAEFCGVFHDRMLLTVRAVPRTEFDTWLATQVATPAAPTASAPAATQSPTP